LCWFPGIFGCRGMLVSLTRLQPCLWSYVGESKRSLHNGEGPGCGVPAVEWSLG
jgi:hypothetical protein